MALILFSGFTAGTSASLVERLFLVTISDTEDAAQSEVAGRPVRTKDKRFSF